MTTKRRFGRPPVGGYGTESVKLPVTIRLPKNIYRWLIKACGDNVSGFIRDLISKEKSRKDVV